MFEIPANVDEQRLRGEVVLDEDGGTWLTSRLNRSLLAGPPSATKHAIIRDDTIRSGSNTPGVRATTAQKMRIAERLEAAGVVEIEAGYAGIEEHLEFIRELKRSGSKLKLGAHCDYHAEGWEGRIDRAIEAGTDVVNIVGMLGYVMPLGQHPHLIGPAIVDRIQAAAAYAKRQGAFTAIGSVAPSLDEFGAAARAALAGGADRFYLYDTRGWHTPRVMALLVHFLRDIAGDRMEIAVHCHDDFGMATANTIEAICAGATAADTTLIRTGHRCGNASLEQVVAGLEAIHGVSTGIRLDKLRELAQLVSSEYGVTIPPNAPIVGDNMYTYGGAHIAALLGGNWFIWENIKAEAVGHERNIVFGITALRRGTTSPVIAKLKQMGITATDRQIEQIYERLQAVVDEEREASLSRMEQIIHDVVAPA